MKYLCASGFVFVCGISTALAGPLHDAAKTGDVEQAKQLLDAGAAIEELDPAGDPALVIASLAGNKAVVVLLLERGSDIHARNRHGLTPLHAAAYGGSLEVASLLVTKGADVNDTKNFYKMSPLHAASEEGHAEVARFLLDHDAEIEATERNGYTPLTQAGWREHWPTATMLMAAGATCQKADLVGEWLYAECNKRKTATAASTK